MPRLAVVVLAVSPFWLAMAIPLHPIQSRSFLVGNMPQRSCSYVDNLNLGPKSANYNIGNIDFAVL